MLQNRTRRKYRVLNVFIIFLLFIFVPEIDAKSKSGGIPQDGNPGKHFICCPSRRVWLHWRRRGTLDNGSDTAEIEGAIEQKEEGAGAAGHPQPARDGGPHALLRHPHPPRPDPSSLQGGAGGLPRLPWRVLQERIRRLRDGERRRRLHRARAAAAPLRRRLRRLRHSPSRGADVHRRSGAGAGGGDGSAQDAGLGRDRARLPLQLVRSRHAATSLRAPDPAGRPTQQTSRHPHPRGRRGHLEDNEGARAEGVAGARPLLHVLLGHGQVAARRVAQPLHRLHRGDHVWRRRPERGGATCAARAHPPRDGRALHDPSPLSGQGVPFGPCAVHCEEGGRAQGRASRAGAPSRARQHPTHVRRVKK